MHMYICLCVYVCVYMCACIYVYMYRYIHIYIYINGEYNSSKYNPQNLIMLQTYIKIGNFQSYPEGKG